MTAAFYGFIGLLMSSLSAHAIKPMLIENVTFESFNTAQNILLIHSLIALIAVLMAKIFEIELFNWGAVGFLLGSLLFSLPIFLKGFNFSSALNFVIPIGGAIMMASWILIIISALKIR